MMKQLVMITALLAVIVATGCPQLSEVATEDSKASYLIKDQTMIRVSADWQLLKEPFRPAGITPFENILVQGDVDPSVRYYIVPKAKVLYNGQTLAANTRIKTFRVEYLPIENVGGPPVLLEPLIWEGVIDYDHRDENGDPVITDRDGHPLARTVIAGVVSYYVIRETTQGVVCLMINLTAGIPVCWNIPFFKSDGPELAFDPEDLDAAMEKLADPKTFRGWLEIIPNSHDLAWVRWQITYEAKAKNTNMAWQTKPQSGIFVFDWDSDGWRNDYEIEMGTDPYDPNDPGNGIEYTNVPCEPDYPHVAWTLEDAVEALDDAGLLLDSVVYENSNTVPEGGFLRFSPPCGTSVPVGSEVNVHISAGPLKVEVPVIEDHLISQAPAILAAANLILGQVIEVYSNQPISCVIDQDPEAGTLVPVGSAVAAYVSKGPEGPNPLVVVINSPANNFVGTVGQAISFSSTVSGGTTPYSFKWHFPDNSFKYQEDVTKTFDVPGAGWVYLDVTDVDDVTVRKEVWVQINSAP